MTDKLVEQETRRWLYCCACGAPVKGSPDCNCQYFVISREEFLGYTKALASSSVPEQLPCACGEPVFKGGLCRGCFDQWVLKFGPSAIESAVSGLQDSQQGSGE